MQKKAKQNIISIHNSEKGKGKKMMLYKSKNIFFPLRKKTEHFYNALKLFWIAMDWENMYSFNFHEPQEAHKKYDHNRMKINRYFILK